MRQLVALPLPSSRWCHWLTTNAPLSTSKKSCSLSATSRDVSLSSLLSSAQLSSSPSTAEHRPVFLPSLLQRQTPSSSWTTPGKRRRPCSWWLKPTRRSKRPDPSSEGCSGKGCSDSLPLFTSSSWWWWGGEGALCTQGPSSPRTGRFIMSILSLWYTNNAPDAQKRAAHEPALHAFVFYHHPLIYSL